MDKIDGGAKKRKKKNPNLRTSSGANDVKLMMGGACDGCCRQCDQIDWWVRFGSQERTVELESGRGEKGTLQKNVKKFTLFLIVKTFYKILHSFCCLIENILQLANILLLNKYGKICKIVYSKKILNKTMGSSNKPFFTKYKHKK